MAQLRSCWSLAPAGGRTERRNLKCESDRVVCVCVRVCACVHVCLVSDRKPQVFAWEAHRPVVGKFWCPCSLDRVLFFETLAVSCIFHVFSYLLTGSLLNVNQVRGRQGPRGKASFSDCIPWMWCWVGVRRKAHYTDWIRVAWCQSLSSSPPFCVILI